MNYFEELNQVDVSGKTEKKNNLTYLSWSWAWGELKKRYPTCEYKVYENEDNGCIYFTDGKTCWVKCSVTVPVPQANATFDKYIEHIEYLPVMDFRNKSIPLEQVTSMDVNKAIQRCLTKAIARHGLGLYIYAGEDLPETVHICESCKREIVTARGMSPERIAEGTLKSYGKKLCMVCAAEEKARRAKAAEVVKAADNAGVSVEVK